MMRGRLIFPFLAELCRLDTHTIETDPDGSDPFESGYDPDFKESILIDTDDDGVGERFRREHSPVRIPCQVEPKIFEELRLFASGNSPRSQVDLVFLFRDLERLGLVRSGTGDALIGPGYRLVAIYDLAGELVQAIRTPPGLYVTEARPAGFGLCRVRPRRNLLIVSFSDRQLATRRNA